MKSIKRNRATDYTNLNRAGTFLGKLLLKLNKLFFSATICVICGSLCRVKSFQLLFFLVVALNVTAQNVLMSEYPNEDTIIPKYGPNLKKFYFVYIGYEAFADDFSDNSANIRNRASGRTSFGFKFKRRITNF